MTRSVPPTSAPFLVTPGKRHADGKEIERAGSPVWKKGKEAVKGKNTDDGESPQPPPRQMSILSWNCRGLGNPHTVRDLCRLVKVKKPSLVFLMETKLRSVRMESIKAILGFDCVFTVDCVGRSGGLALL